MKPKIFLLTLLAFASIAIACSLFAPREPQLISTPLVVETPGETFISPTVIWTTSPTVEQLTTFPVATEIKTQISPTLFVPPPVTSTVEVVRQRIQFIAGASSTSIEGDIHPGEAKEFVLHALEGQWMMVDLGLPNEGLKMVIFGLGDGNYLLSASEGRTNWQGWLPATQYYFIHLISETTSLHYYLSVIIPVRIRFQPGAFSETIEGVVQSRTVNYYILRANVDQTMRVNIISPNHDVLLTIYGLEDGSPLVRYISGDTQWEGRLPATQDYIIEAVSVGETTSYIISVTIR